MAPDRVLAAVAPDLDAVRRRDGRYLATKARDTALERGAAVLGLTETRAAPYPSRDWTNGPCIRR